MSEKLEAVLNGQYDIYAAAREEYRKVIADQEVKIDLLRKALVTCKADWMKSMQENKLLRTALERIRELNADLDGWAHSDMIEQEVVFAFSREIRSIK